MKEQRVSWRVARSGAYAACTVLRPGLPPALEIRRPDGAEIHTVPHLGPTSQLLATEDGVWMCHHRDGRHLIERLVGGTARPVASSDAQGLALIDTRVALEFADGRSRIMLIDKGDLREVARFPGPAAGAVVLGDGRVSVDVVGSNGHCSAHEVALDTGEVTPLFEVSHRSSDRVVDYVEATNLIVVSTDAAGETRLGTGHPGQEPVRFPEILCGPGAATCLATDAHHMAVGFDVGARTVVRVVDLARGEAVPLDLPPLVVLGRGALSEDVLTLPASTPDRPAALLRIDITSGVWAFDDEPSSATSDLLTLPGPDGALECVVVGDVANARAVVIALHGGPFDAWRAMYDPFLAGLAEAGIAVVAPNIRGSVGYGRAHARAIIGNWGGPDLQDVLAVGAAVAKLRSPTAALPVLFGVSYGAWLAVLAAEREPDEWSGCIALAPFLSGARVAAADGPVAELVRRLGGTTSPDLREGLARLSVPLMVLHGEGDDVVPAAESQELRRVLGPRGDGVRLIPGQGHDLLASPIATDVLDDIVAFVRSTVATADGPAPTTGRG